MPQNRPRTIYLFLAFVVLTVIAYWQIAFLQNSLKWDMLGCYLPWRYHVGECLQNGVFPFWNPYTHFGYPIHADLRSVWYPETFLIGLTTGYSYLTLHLLFVVHLSLAGLGMYLLSTHFTSNWRASFIAGAAYLMSGFFVSHGQEMFGIIAATWIPFVLYYFIRLQQNHDFRDIPRTAIFVFLLVTGGYQAMWAILIYLLAAIFIASFIRHFRQQQSQKAWHLLKLNAILAMVTALSLSVIAVTFFQVSSHVGRLGGTTLADAWFMPFSPRSAISFLLPFATVKEVAWYGTDISMNNAYSGLIVLIFFILSLFQKRKLLLNIILGFGLMALLASFGEYTPVRAFLFHYFPLLNLFRHSSFFSYFAVLAIVLSASVGLGNWLTAPGQLRKHLVWISIFLGLIIAGLLNFIVHGELKSMAFFSPAGNFAEWLAAASRHEHMVIHAVLQLIILGIFLFVLFRKKASQWILILISIEMLLAVQLNIYYTVAAVGVKPAELYQNLKQRPEGFPLPQAGASLEWHSERNAAFSLLWQNTNIYNKTVSSEGYNSFRLSSFDCLADSLPHLASAVQKNELIYLSEKILPFSAMDSIDPEQYLKILFVEDSDFSGKFSQLHISPTDSMSIVSFYPGYARVEVQNNSPVAVTLLQAMYPGWSAKVDDKPSDIMVTNKLFISTILPAGRHIVEFEYKNKAVLVGFVVSYITLLLLISIVLYFALSKQRRIIRLGSILIIWLIAVALFLNKFHTPYESRKQKAYESAAHEIANIGAESILLNVDDPNLMEASFAKVGYKGQRFYQNLTYDFGLSRWLDIADSLTDTRISILNLCSAEKTEAARSILQKWPVLLKDIKLDLGNLQVLSSGAQPEGFSSLNDFEADYHGWSGDISRLEDSVSASGKHSNKVDSLHPGSFSYTWKVTEGEANRPFGVFAKARVKGNFEGSSLIIYHRRGTKTIRSVSAGSGTYLINDTEWANISKFGIFPKGAKAGDEVRVFFWGSKNADFNIDNFFVDVRFED